jgi:hypothetical protein
MFRRLFIVPRVFSVLAAPLALLVLSSEARAEPSHEGLFLRLTVGLGGAVSSVDDTPEIELNGVAGFFSFDLGGTLAHGLALHGRISSHSLVNPTVSINGDELGELDASLAYRLFGLGVTYYLPSNLYLTGVLGVSRATLEVDGGDYESDTGFGLSADLGYEWAVGGDWGLGIAGRFEHHSVPTEDSERLIGNALGVLFSATWH